MGKILFSFLAAGLAILAYCMGGGSQPPSLQSSPQRLASLAPAITETLHALGQGEKLVGVTSFCISAPGEAPKPVIGGFREANLEAIARSNADLVILPADMVHFREAIEALGIPVMLFDYGSVPAFLASVKALGRVSASETQAQRLLDEFSASIKQNSQEARPAVLFVVLNPDELHQPLSEMTIAGADEFYNDIIAAAGGRNVYNGNIPFPRISLEAALALNPDVIAIAAQGARDINGLSETWRRLADPHGSKNDRFVLLNEPGDTIPGPSALSTIRKLAAAIKPAQDTGDAAAN